MLVNDEIKLVFDSGETGCANSEQHETNDRILILSLQTPYVYWYDPELGMTPFDSTAAKLWPNKRIGVNIGVTISCGNPKNLKKTNRQLCEKM